MGKDFDELIVMLSKKEGIEVHGNFLYIVSEKLRDSRYF